MYLKPERNLKNKKMILTLILSSLIMFETFRVNEAACGCNMRDTMVSGFDVGDMRLTANDVLIIGGFRAATGPQWPSNRLFFQFDPQYPESNKGALRGFLKEYERELGNCISFAEQRSETTAIVTVGGGCSSNVGYYKGADLRLTLPGPCVNTRNVKHEFTHMLGFMHEHTRPDRDQAIDVFLDNVETPYCNNFHLCKGCVVTTPYDILSIMQYPSDAFGCEGKKTQQKKGGGDIPFNTRVTQFDIKKVRDRYKC